MKYLYLLCLSCLVSTLAAQKSYSLLYDQHYSAMAAGETLLTAHKVASDAAWKVLPAKLTDESTRRQRNLGRLYRALKFLLLEATIDHLTMLTQHEIFGHGARYRQAGFFENFYHLELLPPYGSGGGIANWGKLPTGKLVTEQEWILFYMGGSEANRVMANRLQYKWLASGQMHFRETFLWLEAFQDATIYIQASTARSNGDVTGYIDRVNEFYGEEVVTLDQLKLMAAVNWLNPFQWMVFTHGFGNYWWNGNTHGNIWMIPIGNTQYLPVVRTGLNPFGGEIQFENFLKVDQRIYTFTFRQGLLSGASNWGLRLGGTRLFSNSWLQLDGYLDIWRQPSISIGRVNAIENYESGIGGSAQAEIFINSFFQEKLRFHGLVLYKSVGYLEGEELDEAWRIAVGLNFDL